MSPFGLNCHAIDVFHDPALLQLAARLSEIPIFITSPFTFIYQRFTAFRIYLPKLVNGAEFHPRLLIAQQRVRV